jgi:CRISPR-associated protein Csm1
MLENFFSGWLQTELRERFPYLYTVYSGGDDLLIIGPWDHVIDFAAALNREFNRYVCGNPNITLSAGIALANPHTPVFSATRQADHLLEESKNAGRNRLTVFGATMEWGQVPAILGQARQLAEWMRGGVVPVSFGHRLLRYSTFHRRYKETHDSEYLRFLPMLKYDIARNLSRPAQREVRLWAETLKDLASPNLQHLRFSASYALNANRRGGQHDTR